jgi:Family of unknown function (DUF5330)
MFLFRTAFWLGVVVLVLPTDAQQQEKVYKSVSNAAHQAATFCDRNPTVCQRGAEAWTTFKQKLEFGVRVAMDVATERMQGKEERPPSARSSLQPATSTLTPADIAPAWRGKARQGA